MASMNELMRQYVIEQLHSLHVTEIEGKSLESFDYDRLKEELVLSSFRQIDTEVTANRWY